MSPELRDPLADDQGIRVAIKRAGSVNDTSQVSSVFERVATNAPRAQTWRLGSLSDRAIAWLFVAPTVLLLLAITGLFGIAFVSLELYEFHHLIHEGDAE